MALISIVVPVYFNAPTLSTLKKRLDELADANTQHQFEFIFVDDCSGDNSFTVLRDLAQEDCRMRVLKLARNFGSNTAFLAGLSYASGDCVGFIAADLQDPPEKFTEMVRSWESGYKVVLAVRKDRHGDPLATRITAKLFNWLFSHLVFNGYSPQGIGFTLIDRQVADFLIQSNEKNAHIIGMILWSGFEYDTVEYDRVERKFGKSRWTFQKKIKYFIDAFAAFSYLPLRLASALGILIALGGGVYAVDVILGRLLHQIEVPGWTAMMVVVLLLSGVQLIMLGVIGEYLWRNFDATRKRPIFIVDKAINCQQPAIVARQRSAEMAPVTNHTGM